MGTTLITEIPIFVFSSQIGGIELSTDQEKIVIVVEDGTTEIFTTSLYAFDGKVEIVNIGEVLENYMIANGKVFTAFTVYYNTADGSNLGSFNLNTLFCSLRLDIEAGVFASYNFLTTLTAKRVPRGANETLSLLHGQESGQLLVHCVFTTTLGLTDNHTLTMRSITTDDIGVTMVSIPYNVLRARLQLLGVPADRLLSYTVEFNGRSFTYYVTDNMPEVSFTFRNCFNVDETAYFNAITTTKTKVNRSMAISLGEHLFYDQSVDKTYEVQTASLTADEAYWVEQLLFSHSVRLGTSSSIDSLPEVIITESECEIADNDEELNKVKFTWQFAKTAPHLQKSFRSDNSGVFTEPYNNVFD